MTTHQTKWPSVLIALAASSCDSGSDYYPLFPPGTQRVYSMRATIPGMLAGDQFQINYAADTVIWQPLHPNCNPYSGAA